MRPASSPEEGLGWAGVRLTRPGHPSPLPPLTGQLSPAAFPKLCSGQVPQGLGEAKRWQMPWSGAESPASGPSPHLGGSRLSPTQVSLHTAQEAGRRGLPTAQELQGQTEGGTWLSKPQEPCVTDGETEAQRDQMTRQGPAELGAPERPGPGLG